ncbi:Uncharacterised protein [Segatella copri]|nr:Uncharacterised protein [Segatella copri]
MSNKWLRYEQTSNSKSRKRMWSSSNCKGKNWKNYMGAVQILVWWRNAKLPYGCRRPS